MRVEQVMGLIDSRQYAFLGDLGIMLKCLKRLGIYYELAVTASPNKDASVILSIVADDVAIAIKFGPGEYGELSKLKTTGISIGSGSDGLEL